MEGSGPLFGRPPSLQNDPWKFLNHFVERDLEDNCTIWRGPRPLRATYNMVCTAQMGAQPQSINLPFTTNKCYTLLLQHTKCWCPTSGVGHTACPLPNDHCVGVNPLHSVGLVSYITRGAVAFTYRRWVGISHDLRPVPWSHWSGWWK